MNPVRSIVLALLAALGALAPAAPAGAAEDPIRLCAGTGMQPPCTTLAHGATDLRQWGVPTRLGSFSINRGGWMLCSAPDFQGRCEIHASSRSNLRGSAFETTGVLSLRPIRARADHGRARRSGSDASRALAIAVYTGTHYTGRARVYAQDAVDLAAEGLDEPVGSVRVLGGIWQVCRRPAFKDCTTIQRGLPELSRAGFAGTVGSLRETSSARNGRSQSRADRG